MTGYGGADPIGGVMNTEPHTEVRTGEVREGRYWPSRGNQNVAGKLSQ